MILTVDKVHGIRRGFFYLKTQKMPYYVWDNYMEMCEDIRYTEGMKELFSHRKETIERIFGTAKENHGFWNQIEKYPYET